MFISISVSKHLEGWRNVEHCNAAGTNKSCGPGELLQQTKCIDGTFDKCESHTLERYVPCSEANAKLPDCEKIFGSWENVGSCVANGVNSSCGPGVYLQERKCIDGTLEKCTNSETTQTVSCLVAENPLPPCEMIKGQWTNVTNCLPNNIEKSCGPGTVIMTRDCTDGSNDLCQNIETRKNVSCEEAELALPDCKGKL